MKFVCPNCQKTYDVPNAHPGKKARCKQCGHIFVIAPQPIEITPRPDLPFAAAANGPPPASHTAARTTGRAFVSLWSRSPVAFRTAFLATLGVLCALCFAWSVMGMGAKLTAPPAPQIPAAQPVAVHTGDRAEYLAAATLLIQTYERYNTLQQVRTQAAKDAVNNLHLVVLLRAVLEPLEHCYRDTNRYRIPDQGNLRQVHKALLEAVDAEYSLVQVVLSAVETPTDLKAKGAMDAALNTVRANDTYLGSEVVRLMLSLDEGFFDAYARIAAVQNN